MNVFSVKKYFTAGALYVLGFLGLLLATLCISVVKSKNAADFGTFMMVGAVIGGAVLLPIAAYYLIMGAVYRKKCAQHTPVMGVVSNWEIGFMRNTACICLKTTDGTEYKTSAVFGIAEAKEMVGKPILYAIVDEQLLVYEVKDDA